MYLVNFYKNNKTIGTEKYMTIEEAENKLENSEYYNIGDYYEIIDEEKDEVTDSSEIVDPDDILDDMFDGEESKEGFDWTLGD